MKFKIVLIAISLLAITACKSSNGHCDAYGNKATSK
jgi:hypothetical protein